MTIGFVEDDNRDIGRDFFFNSFTTELTATQWYKTDAQIAYFFDNTDLANPADTGTGFNNPNVEFTDVDFGRLFVRSHHYFVAYPGVEFEIGYQLMHDDIDVANSFTTAAALTPVINETRTVHSAIFDHRLTLIDPFSFQAGVRYDRYSDFGLALTPGATLTYNYKPQNMIFHGAYRQGFRAPSIQELALPVFGNPDLGPEKSYGGDIGVEKRFEKQQARLRVVYFGNVFRQLIAVSSNGIFDNVQRAYSHGVETSGCIALIPELNGCLAYTFTTSQLDAENGDESKIPLFSRNVISASVEGQALPKLWVRGSVHFRDDQTVAAIPGVTLENVDGSNIGGNLSGYTKVDIDARYRVYDKWMSMADVDLTLHMENLLNQSYQELPGFENPGVSALGGVLLTFL